MKHAIASGWAALFVWGCLPLSSPLLRAQDAAAPETARPKRVVVGGRLRYFPMNSASVMADRTLLTTTTSGLTRDWDYTTESKAPWWSAGAVLEYRRDARWSLIAEVLFSRLRYTKVADIYWGTNNAATGNDDRTHMSIRERTRAALWDIPLLVRRNALTPSGPFSRIFVDAGVTLRTAAGINSYTQNIYPDTSASASGAPADPSRKYLVGGTVGLGFRIIDDFKLNWTPEVRYTRWAGSTFSSDSTVSPRNQVEVGFALTF
jgi:hypothetical protein